MKWNNQRKIAVGLLGLAFAAFLGDRFFFLDGQPDLAIQPDGIAKPASGGAAGTAAKDASAIASGMPMAALARKMEEICLAEGLIPGKSKDAFQPPAAWFPPPPEAAPAPATAAASKANEFKSKYKLTAVMRSGATSKGGLAVIQGQTIRVGQSIGGFQLKAIQDRSVVVSDGREDVELVLLDAGVATVE